MARHPGLSDIVPVLLYRTLGPLLPDGAAHIAPLWLACHRAASTMETAVQRALDTGASGFALGEELFEKALTSPSGFAFSRHDHDEVWQLVGGRIQLAVPVCETARACSRQRRAPNSPSSATPAHG